MTQATPMERASSVRSQPQSSMSGPRFLPRIITNVFARRSEDQPTSPRFSEADGRRSFATPVTTQAPAPKLEYVKLPGTKNSIMIKAVETAKKSFLAILCGDNGEKIELFAGTYRTALGLSRTFILPDSPKSLELQLQGDDLVEVFLVFSQNVFGLEPATVRVREVRIGRAERRAARRRLRETQQAAEQPDGDAAHAEEDTAVNVTIGVSVPAPSISSTEENQTSPIPSPLPGTTHPADTASTADASSTSLQPANNDELITLATAHMSSYTTFQQLTFAPNFPLATIADEYVIPPTYTSFVDYKTHHEPDNDVNQTTDITQVQFTPPGLPVPVSAPPSQWYYRDPKGVLHGPWKASVMQTWYKDGLLPLDLPVRREEDDEFILLKDLRLQAVDPTFPFRSSPVLTPLASGASSSTAGLPLVDPAKPLLSPISLLRQPRHFGPPALFFSSRGGHSTTIVDARGRSVLRGRFLWSPDDDEDSVYSHAVRLGDVKRLEAFDVEDRSVLVAMRQGGLEVVDFGDALLQPADHSRTIFPHFHPPTSAVNRRGPFVWRIGMPLSASSSTLSLSSLPPKPLHRKKQSTGPIRSPGRNDTSASGEADVERDEVLFLGRKDDEVYICERRIGSFRILRLAPTHSVS
ncbi:hypothetical protein NM688_g8564 [Phlebia brevispora]|uniref:Uncharacterized protein n=1 Tax=Phlebia brevispora TaxID=194682 RepID=A0ACC1RSU1_9APHY|nr:hypothetical protein NM688_g8564 [Phlebia brevispora]